MSLYDIIGAPRTVSGEKEIYSYVKKSLKSLDKKKLSKEEYNEKKKQIKEAHDILRDYHKRHAYDNSLDTGFPSTNLSMFMGTDLLSENKEKDIFSILPLNFPKMLNTKNGQKYSHESMHIMNMDKDGEKIVYSTSKTDHDGKIDKTMKKTIIDKNGNKKEAPFTEKEMKAMMFRDKDEYRLKLPSIDFHEI